MTLKRMLDCQASDVQCMDGAMLKRAIRAAEGRTLVSECIVCWTPLLRDVSNPELARAFGADLILLNLFDVDDPCIEGLPSPRGNDVIATLKRYIGRPVGINLEPVDDVAVLWEERSDVPPGRMVSEHTVRRALELGFDFVCVTGNPKTGVTTGGIVEGVRTVRRTAGSRLLVMAGKMHAAGVETPWTTEELRTTAEQLVDAGADVIVLPVVRWVHELGGLVMAVVGTSQEGADVSTIRRLVLNSKEAGADLFHLGDAGTLGIAEPENLLAASVALRGRRHTWRRMAASPLR
jgi:hypothetical protein